jgi:bZIP transcription factor
MAAESIPHDAAQARKRRIAARNRSTDNDLAAAAGAVAAVGTDATADQNKRPRVEVEDQEPSSTCSSPETVVSADANGKPIPHITGIKKQSRYDPGVPMNREELKAWRKEARRVRNRESAAASRKKNKDRISELETEVDTLQTKYAAALQLLLQREAGGQRSIAFVPAILRQDLMDAALNDDAGFRSTSPVLVSGDSIVAVSPPLSPSVPVSTHEQLLLPPPPTDATTGAPLTVSNVNHSNTVFSHPSRNEKKDGSFIFGRLSDQHSKSHHQHITPIIRPIACV